MKPVTSSVYFNPESGATQSGNEGEEPDDDYSDYDAKTYASSSRNFESEKLVKKPKDVVSSGENSKNFYNWTSNSSQKLSNDSNLDLEKNESENKKKLSKLLFSSPSATVTSNGPSVSWTKI